MSHALIRTCAQKTAHAVNQTMVPLPVVLHRMLFAVQMESIAVQRDTFAIQVLIFSFKVSLSLKIPRFL